MAEWLVDPDHSVAAFSVRHMMIANVRGQFNGIEGKINFDPADVPNSSVELTIKVASIVTGIQKRDDHLLSPDFFDAEKYPVITFKSTNVEYPGHNRGMITGEFTIHGVKKPVVLEAEYFGPVKDPFGEGASMGFSATTTINREDYGIIWNHPMDDGGVMVGKEVRVSVDIEADLVKA